MPQDRGLLVKGRFAWAWEWAVERFVCDYFKTPAPPTQQLSQQTIAMPISGAKCYFYD
jgi:hypothetical protein